MVLETAPRSGRPYHRDNPQGAVRARSFGACSWRRQYAIPIAFLRVAGSFSAASMAWAASAREIA